MIVWDHNSHHQPIQQFITCKLLVQTLSLYWFQLEKDLGHNGVPVSKDLARNISKQTAIIFFSDFNNLVLIIS